MKKLFISLACVAMVALTSCGGSNQSKINEAKELQKEYRELIEKAQACDDIEEAKELTEKAKELSAKGREIIKELKKANLTEDEMQQLMEL